MFKGGAVPSKDGAGRGSDGEGLAAPPAKEPQSQQQLDPHPPIPTSRAKREEKEETSYCSGSLFPSHRVTSD